MEKNIITRMWVQSNMIEIVVVVGILVIALIYSGLVNPKSFIDEDSGYLSFLKEKDYDFYVAAKYGETASPNKLFIMRLRNAFVAVIVFLIMMISNLNFINLLMTVVIGYLVFKMPYMSLRTYYKRYMHQIDLMLPYYLKNLEILCQNYTVPVAIARSIESAPDVFKSGLRTLVAKIDAGDSSIQPYMDFAIEYPVRDSMRMMRLLYRLGLGAQENKYKQLLVFSKSVSSLQSKARELKYKNRLQVMERKTMIMLVVTGGGTMVILLMSMLMLFGI